MSGLQIIETLKASGGESEFFARWAGYQAKALRAEQDLSRSGQQIGVVPGAGADADHRRGPLPRQRQVMDGELTIGMLVAYQTLMASFTRPLGTLVSFASSIQELRGDMSRLDDVLNHRRDPQYERSERGEHAQRREDQARRQGRAAQRDLRLQPGRAAAGRGLQSHRRARAARRAGRRQRQRQDHGLEAGGRSLRAWSGEVLFDGVPRDAAAARA